MLKQIPPITRNLLIINVLCYLLQLVCAQRVVDLTALLGLHFILASDFAPWQLLSYMFLHGSFTHLFFNMFSLWMFGRIIEQTMRPQRFLLYYLVCGIGAGLCQELWQTGEYFLYGLADYPLSAIVNVQGDTIAQVLNSWTTIGASGACYGVLLAFGMTFPNERIMLLLPPIPMKAKYFVMGYAAIELFSAFTSNGNIAHFAHLGGMLFGLLLLLHWRREGRSRRGNRFESWDTWTPRRSRTLAERWRDFTARFHRAPRKKGKNAASESQFKDRAADYDYNRRAAENQARVDAILDKIRRAGYESLSAEEKRFLFENSRK